MAVARDRTERISPATMDERRYVPALLVAFGVANLTAYARDATIAASFGAGSRTDAFFIATFLPTLLATILVFESSVPALLPALSRLASDGAAVRRLLRASLAVGFVILAATVALLASASLPVVRLLAHGFGPGQAHLAAALLRITAGSIVPLGLGAVLGALLNVRHRYLAPPLGLAAMNGTTIAMTLLLAGRLGIYAPAWGMLAGSCTYLLLQVLAVKRLDLEGGRPLQSIPLRALGGALLPMLLFSLLIQNVTIVERWLASALPSGQISYLVYAGKLMMSPLLVITAAGGLVAFVAMSQASAADDRQTFRTSMVRSARLLTILLLAATLVLIILPQPVVQLALQHGRFTSHDVDMTSTLLAIYALGLIPNGLSWVLYRSLQSRGRYWEAVWVALIGAIFYVGCAAGLFHAWGLRGIAAAFPISQTVSCLVLYALQPSYLRVSLRAGTRFAARLAVLAAAIAVPLAALRPLIGALRLGTTVGAGLALAAGAVIILSGLAFGTQLLQVPEGALVRGWLARPIRRLALGRD